MPPTRQPDASKPVAPATEQRCWPWYYLNLGRGADALKLDRTAFCRHLWSFFCQTWRFNEPTYRRTVASFDNPDFVDVILHSYRDRIDDVAGDSALADIKHRLSRNSQIIVPAIVLGGGDDGVDLPIEEAKLKAHFCDLRQRTILPGSGRNVPQNALVAFAAAILELIRPSWTPPLGKPTRSDKRSPIAYRQPRPRYAAIRIGRCIT